jgi:hypothetical protein
VLDFASQLLVFPISKMGKAYGRGVIETYHHVLGRGMLG